jgi:hypothetical protein
MKLGEHAHIIFRRHLQKKAFFDRLIPKSFLKPIGGIEYFLNDDKFETRVYIQNYFALLADSPNIHAKWNLDVYSSGGELAAHKEGVFEGPQGVVVEIGALGNIGKYGVIQVSIDLDDDTYRLDLSPHTVFYTEYSERKISNPRKVISHSLGYPSAGVYSYDRSFTGLILGAGCTPHLLYASGSLLKPEAPLSWVTGTLEITNSDQKTLSIPLPEIHESLGSHKVDLLAAVPNLRAHVSDKPFSLRIKGRNILSKPFLFLVGDHIFLGDHL